MKKNTYLFFSLFLQLFSFTVADQPPLHWWPLDEAVGVTAVDSGSGTPHNLTLSGGAAFLGPGVQLDGSGDFLDLGDNFAFAATNGFTFAAWVRYDAFQNYGVILYLYDGLTFLNLIQLYNHGTTRRARVDIENNNIFKSFTTPDCNPSDGANDPCYFFPPVGQWAHVVFVASASGFTLYRNGETRAEWTTSDDIIAPNPNSATYPNAALGRNDYGSNYFKGALRDVRLYDRALSESEVRGLSAWGLAVLNGFDISTSSFTCHKYCRFMNCNHILTQYAAQKYTCQSCPDEQPFDNFNWLVQDVVATNAFYEMNNLDISNGLQTFTDET